MSPRCDGCDTLVVVKTPLQILNVLEARHHFGFRRPALRLLTSRKFTRKLLLSLVEPSEWESVEFLDLDPERLPVRIPGLGAAANEELTEIRWVYKQWHLRQRYDRFFRPWQGIENLVIGNYHQAHFMHLANLCRADRCILVDDGTDTFRVAEGRREVAAGSAVKRPAPDLWRDPKGWWMKNETGWDLAPQNNLVFFSTYDLDLPANDTLVRNRYLRASSHAQSAGRDSRVLFLGQPLVEDGYLSQDVFRGILAEVRQSLADQPLVYVPHPRENRVELARVLDACGMTLGKIDKPFEFHLLESPTLPTTVASFFSSALDNCRLIWGRQMRLLAYRLHPDSLRVSPDFVAEVYRYFATEGAGAIEILDLGRPA